LEILIIDDGSTDGGMDSIGDLNDRRIRIFRQQNRGKPAALNVGLDHATGDFCAVHDADDLSDPQRIEMQVQCMRDNPDVAAVYCGHDLILNDRRIAPYAPARDRAQCRAKIDTFLMPAHDPTGMYRMSMVRSMRYDESLPIVEGYDYILRVGERYPMLVLDQCLYGYRVHAESVTRRDPTRRDRLVVELMRRACERRRVDPKLALPHVFGDGVSWTPSDDNNLAAHFLESACDLRRRGRMFAALSVGWRCALLRPRSARYWKPLVCAALPVNLVRRARARHRRLRTVNRPAVSLEFQPQS
jgi:glycosyltransferase involved in cell wall biosynthesis